MSELREFAKRTSLVALGLFVLASCAESTGPEPQPEPTVSPEPATRTVEQAVIDPNGPNWVAVGGDGRLELLGGEDGEPDVTSGRFALDANPITDASSGNGRWIVVGTGLLQALDMDASRLRPAREILAGEAANFVERGNGEWLVGGGAGQLQRIDDEGEPSLDVAQILAGTTDATAAGWNGASWLIGTADGQIVRANSTLTSVGTASSPFGGSPIRGVTSDTLTSWVAFSSDSWIKVTAAGAPSGTPTQLEAGLEITEATTIGNNIFVGTADGRVAAFDPALMTNTSGWQNVFSNGEVTKIASEGTGTIIALSSEGQAAVLDGSGSVTTAATDVVPGLSLEGAWFADGRWLVAAGPIGFIRFVGESLAPVRTLAPLLSGGDIYGVSPSNDGMLVVGSEGRTQFVDSLGQPVGAVETVGTTADLLDVEWNGEDFLTVAADGTIEIVSGNGTPQGGGTTALDGGRIEFAAWSGEFWLVGGEGGNIQRVRADGSIADPEVVEIPEMANALDARFSGSEWLVGGTTSDGIAVVARVAPSGDVVGTVRIENFPGRVEAVEYNGIEWLVAGSGGLFQRINPEGGLVGMPMNLLNGYDVLSMTFNGRTLLAGGEFGSVRQFTQSLQPLRPALGVLDSRSVFGIDWSAPRGFAEGPCLDESGCYVGPCVGGLNTGVCCDRACTLPCESCFMNETGEPDGTCAPVVAGRRPPVKIHVESAGCEAQPTTSCGTTGLCDGAGQCAFHEVGTLCGLDAQCSATTFTPAQACAGDGSACPDPEPMSCEPYTGCSVDGGCATTCADDSECFEGFVCENATCVEESEEPEMPAVPKDSDDDGGCCAVVPAAPADSHLGLLVLLVGGAALLLRRR